MNYQSANAYQYDRLLKMKPSVSSLFCFSFHTSKDWYVSKTILIFSLVQYSIIHDSALKVRENVKKRMTSIIIMCQAWKIGKWIC